jgi:hypothetical protein
MPNPAANSAGAKSQLLGLAAAMLGTSPLGPNGLRLVEGTLALARAAGLPDAIAAYTGELLGRYIAVAVLEQESNRERFGAAGQEEIRGWIDEYRRYLENLPADQFPTLVQIARSGQMMLEAPAKSASNSAWTSSSAGWPASPREPTASGHTPRSCSPGYQRGKSRPCSDSGRGPKMRRSSALILRSLMEASRRLIRPFGANSHSSLP